MAKDLFEEDLYDLNVGISRVTLNPIADRDTDFREANEGPRVGRGVNQCLAGITVILYL